jgi:hypothetical protein
MQCAEGHEGPICNICQPGYSKSIEVRTEQHNDDNIS